jgi:hypothetical protein
VFLNESYYLILNETDSINATMITLDQLLTQLQVNMTALDLTLIKSINGQLPVNHQMLIGPSPGAYITVTDNVPSSGHVTVGSTGIVTVNGVNLNRTLNIVPGAGISIVQTPPNIVNISNTVADLFTAPCVISVSTTAGYSSLLMVRNSQNEDGWQGFLTPVKSYPSCPQPFSSQLLSIFIPYPPFFLGYYAHFWTQPAGIWQLRVLIGYTAGQIQSCPAPVGCSLSWSVGIRDTVTGEDQYLDTTFWNIGGAYTTVSGFFQAQVLMNGYRIPPGRIFKFFVYYGSYYPVDYLTFYQTTMVATRIG